MTGLLPLRMAIARYGHTAALKDGAIDIKGVLPTFVEVNPIISAYRRMIRDLEFDVCEMAPVTYLVAREAGIPIKALPIFVFRRFHHAGLVSREGAGVNTPKDLEGKRVGVRAYSVTTGVWTRGILSDEYGVDHRKITWVVDDEEHVPTLQLPANVCEAPKGRSLVELMRDGSIAAAFTGNAGLGRAGAPAGGWHHNGMPQNDLHRELFESPERLESAWFSKTGVYPIHSLVVVKEALLDQHPWLSHSLFEAFLGSKMHYMDQLSSGANISDKDAHYREMAKVVGDPLPYGFGENRSSIDTLIRYCHEQGLLKRCWPSSDLFLNPLA